MMIKAFYLDLVIQMSIVSNLDHEKHATRGGWNGLGIGRNGKYHLKLNKKKILKMAEIISIFQKEQAMVGCGFFD